MAEKISKIISIIFHPVLIPTLGTLLLLNSGFYFAAVSWDAKRFILLVVLFSTAILPLLTTAVLALNPKFDITMEKSTDRVVPLLFSSIFYYLGYMLLDRVGAFAAFKLFLIASIIVLIILMVVSLKWKISNHMAAIGGLTGTFFALSFRAGVNPLYIILLLVLLSGIIGTARMLLNKHNIWQIAAGYFTGFIILYFVIYFF